MIFRSFTHALHKDYGFWGWKPDWIPQADPVIGSGLPHDILEHRKGDRITFSDEFRALGASLYVRNNDYYYVIGHRTPDISWHMAADIGHMLEQIVERDLLSRFRPQRTRPLPDSWIEAQIEKAVMTGLENFLEDHGYEELAGEVKRVAMPIMVSWMRQGYRHAQARYRGVDQGLLLDTFMQIERIATKTLSWLTEGEPARLRLSCDPRHSHVEWDVDHAI